MRTLLFAVLVAALPFGICGHLAAAEGPGGIPGGAADGQFWVRTALVAAACVALLAAYRVRTGLLGPGLAASLALCAHPSVPDAAASPYTLPLLGLLAGLSACTLVAAGLLRKAGKGRVRAVFLAAGGLSLVATLLRPAGEAEYGAGALGPPVLSALAFGVLAGETAHLLALRAGPARGALVACLSALILFSAVLGQIRALAWRDAPSFWDRAVAEAPRSPAALGARAGARAASGDRAAAAEGLRAFAEALAAGGGRAFGERARLAGADGVASAARLLLGRGAPSAPGNPREAEAAEAALRAAREFAPGSVPVMIALADACLARGDFLEPIHLLEGAVAADRDEAVAWDALAQARLAAGRVPEALEAARTATGLRPTEKRYVVTWADCLLAAGRGGEAISILHGALGSKPPWDPLVARAFADAEFRLAREDVSAGRPGPARRKLLAAEAFDRSDPARAELLAELDRRMEAERPEMERLLVPGPGGKVDANDWLLYTVWLCRWGEFEDADLHFRRMLELRGTTAAIHYYMGLEFWEGRGSVEGVEKAVAAYQQAVALDPSHVESWNRLWQCQRLLGRTTAARDSARRFFELAPAHPDAAAAQHFLEGE